MKFPPDIAAHKPPMGNQESAYSMAQCERMLSGPALLKIIQPVLALGLPVRFHAKGFSMLPFIQDGDLVRIEPFLGRLPDLGEVVAFCSTGTDRIMVHRVVGKRSAAYLIQGDALPGQPDGWLGVDTLLGRVTEIQRRSRTLHFGLGWERLPIALLSRMGLLAVLMKLGARIWHLINRPQSMRKDGVVESNPQHKKAWQGRK